MHELNVPDRPRPGPVAGAAIGVLSGLLLAAVWRYGARDVALAVTFVFAGLVAAVLAGAPRWRPFGTGLLAGAIAVAVVVTLLIL